MVQLIDANEPPPLTPERAVREFIKQLRLPPAFHSVWIRNEIDGDQVKRIIMVGLRQLPRGVKSPDIPDTFEGFEVRKVKLVPDGTPIVPFTLVNPVTAADKRGR